MTYEELQREAEALHNLFHNMPNTPERKSLYLAWLDIRHKQSEIIYWEGNRNYDGK